MVIANDIKEALHNSGIQSYYTFLEGYDEYLDLNFDGTQNSMSILGNIYLSGKVNNEIYTLKEMMQQPDRKHFEQVLFEEVKAMFDNAIWGKFQENQCINTITTLENLVRISSVNRL